MIKLKLTLKDYGDDHNPLIIYSNTVLTFNRDSNKNTLLYMKGLITTEDSK